MERSMNSALLPLLGMLTAVFAIGFGWSLVAWRKERARAEELATGLARAEERLRLEESNRATLAEHLKAQAALSAEAVAEKLVSRATETFQAQDRLARERLEAQLKPVAETLGKFEKQVQELEKTRAAETGGLKEQIAALLQASSATQAEARKLSAALRRGAGVQGRWGEETLVNVLELAGLRRHFDFQEQVTVDSDEGRRRPDFTVRLPGGGVFAVDAKVSLNAFLEAQEAIDDQAREGSLIRHAQSLKAHVQGLSSKAYWDLLKDQTPDFVAMFVPSDSILAAALDRAPDLMGEAMDKRVLIVTPTTLFALCKAVAYGWRVEEQARNATQIAELGRELYKRVADMGGHAASLGKAIEAAVNRYNAFVGSLENRVLPQARKFEELKVDHEVKEIAELQPVEAAVRPLSKLAAAEDKPALTVVSGD
jgi:DNA recombination protein RmuC